MQRFGPRPFVFSLSRTLPSSARTTTREEQQVYISLIRLEHHSIIIISRNAGPALRPSEVPAARGVAG